MPNPNNPTVTPSMRAFFESNVGQQVQPQKSVFEDMVETARQQSEDESGFLDTVANTVRIENSAYRIGVMFDEWTSGRVADPDFNPAEYTNPQLREEINPDDYDRLLDTANVDEYNVVLKDIMIQRASQEALMKSGGGERFASSLLSALGSPETAIGFGVGSVTKVANWLSSGTKIERGLKGAAIVAPEAALGQLVVNQTSVDPQSVASAALWGGAFGSLNALGRGNVNIEGAPNVASREEVLRSAQASALDDGVIRATVNDNDMLSQLDAQVSRLDELDSVIANKVTERQSKIDKARSRVTDVESQRASVREELSALPKVTDDEITSILKRTNSTNVPSAIGKLTDIDNSLSKRLTDVSELSGPRGSSKGILSAIKSSRSAGIISDITSRLDDSVSSLKALQTTTRQSLSKLRATQRRQELTARDRELGSSLGAAKSALTRNENSLSKLTGDSESVKEFRKVNEAKRAEYASNPTKIQEDIKLSKFLAFQRITSKIQDVAQGSAYRYSGSSMDDIFEGFELAKKEGLVDNGIEDILNNVDWTDPAGLRAAVNRGERQGVTLRGREDAGSKLENYTIDELKGMRDRGEISKPYFIFGVTSKVLSSTGARLLSNSNPRVAKLGEMLYDTVVKRGDYQGSTASEIKEAILRQSDDELVSLSDDFSRAFKEDTGISIQPTDDMFAQEMAKIDDIIRTGDRSSAKPYQLKMADDFIDFYKKRAKQLGIPDNEFYVPRIFNDASVSNMASRFNESDLQDLFTTAIRREQPLYDAKYALETLVRKGDNDAANRLRKAISDAESTGDIPKWLSRDTISGVPSITKRIGKHYWNGLVTRSMKANSLELAPSKDYSSNEMINVLEDLVEAARAGDTRFVSRMSGTEIDEIEELIKFATKGSKKGDTVNILRNRLRYDESTKLTLTPKDGGAPVDVSVSDAFNKNIYNNSLNYTNLHSTVVALDGVGITGLGQLQSIFSKAIQESPDDSVEINKLWEIVQRDFFRIGATNMFKKHPLLGSMINTVRSINATLQLAALPITMLPEILGATVNGSVRGLLDTYPAAVKRLTGSARVDERMKAIDEFTSMVAGHDVNVNRKAMTGDMFDVHNDISSLNGVPTGKTRVANKIERMTAKAARTMNLVSTAIDQSARSFHVAAFGGMIVKHARSGGVFNPKRLESLGIKPDGDLMRYFAKDDYKLQGKLGGYEFDKFDWNKLAQERPDLMLEMQVASRRFLKQSFATPSLSSAPLFAKNEYAQIFLQFRSYSMHSHTQILKSNLRAGDAQAAAYYATASFGAFLAYMSKTYLNAENDRDFNDKMSIDKVAREIPKMLPGFGTMTMLVDTAAEFAGFQPIFNEGSTTGTARSLVPTDLEGYAIPRRIIETIKLAGTLADFVNPNAEIGRQDVEKVLKNWTPSIPGRSKLIDFVTKDIRKRKPKEDPDLIEDIQDIFK